MNAPHPNYAALAVDAEDARYIGARSLAALELKWRGTMIQEMRDESFLTEHADRDEWEESLSRIFAASYGTVDEIACAVVKERELLIDRHAKRRAFTDWED